MLSLRSAGVRRRGSGTVGAAAARGRPSARRRSQAQVRLHDAAQGAAGADEGAREIVARDVLHDAAAETHDGAVPELGGEAEHLGAGGAEQAPQKVAAAAVDPLPHGEVGPVRREQPRPRGVLHLGAGRATRDGDDAVVEIQPRAPLKTDTRTHGARHTTPSIFFWKISARHQT